MASLKLDQLPYTIRNLPYGVVSSEHNPSPRCAVAIGQHAVDLTGWAKRGTIKSLQLGDRSFEEIFAQPTLNTFAALPWQTRKAVREQLQTELKDGKVPSSCLLHLRDAKVHLPMQMSGFSDFYTSLDHCKNCSGELSTASIPKNWYYAPSVYNSRVSSVVPTPTDIRRPKNVYFNAGMDSEPEYGPTRMMDFELEMGFFVSKPVPFGDDMPIGNAKDHIFGFVLLNDWSARDHQLFEMRPLGPFHSKGFGTSISNWITPMEALEPFSTSPHLKQDPPPLEHLTWPRNDDGALDIKLRVKLIRDDKEHIVSHSNLKYLYWTPYQQLTHHAASGCGLLTGDLIGTGTISGSGTDQQGNMSELGCLYEAERTKTTLLPQGSGTYKDGYLEDGDELVLEGWCENDQAEVIFGLGECRGRILPPK